MTFYQILEQIHSLLDWWRESSSSQKSDLCRRLALRAVHDNSIPVNDRKLLINCGLVLRRAMLSSYQENQLLEIIKGLVNLWPDFQWPKASDSALRKPVLFKSNYIENSKTELFNWQKEAITAWIEAGNRGIIKAVTGSGKTIAAIEAIRLCLAKGGRAVIIVPTRALLRQWQKELIKHLNLSSEYIGLAGGGNRCSPAKQPVTIWVINSARNHLANALSFVPKNELVLFVVDECHRAGSKENSKLFSSRYEWIMGLSATPERHGDPGYEKVLIPNIGEQIYNYNFAMALKDGVIPPFDLVNIGVDFSPWEREEYDDLTRRIALELKILMSRYRHIRWHICKNYYFRKCYKVFEILSRQCLTCPFFQEFSDPSQSPQFFKFLYYLVVYEKDSFALHIINLLLRRKRLVKDAKARLPMAVEVLKKCADTHKTLVFLEHIHLAEELALKITEEMPQTRFGLYHSKIAGDVRDKTLEEFRADKMDTLISCHALDEGLDVPSVDMGIIVSSSSSIRQRIQRLGRILRKHPGKNKSAVFNFYIHNTSERQLMFREFKEDGMDEYIGFYNSPQGEEMKMLNEYFSENDTI